MALKGETMEEEKENTTIVIGNKPFKVYIRYAMALIKAGKLEKIVILARGPKNIYKALSLAEIIHRNNQSVSPVITTKSEEIEKGGMKRIFTAVEIRFSQK
jgi:DNA-binding protein